MTKKVKTLVITVDRDDDLGKKTGIAGPLVGEKECIKAAETLAIADPGESDANAMFATIKTYRKLKELGENVEVAIITGHKERGIKADREVLRQLEALKDKYGFEEVVLVSDGADDEQLIPVIQGVTRIANIQRVIVKQSQTIESSFYWLKEVLKDPHFARIIFGLPGIALLVYALVYLLGIERLSFNLVLGLLGAYLIIKGFGIEDAFVNWLSSFKKTTSIERASFPIYISSFLILLLSIWAGLDSSSYYAKQLQIVGEQNSLVPFIGFISGALGLVTLAILLFFAGRIVDMYHRGEIIKIRKYSRSLITTISAYLILDVSIKFFLAWTRATTGPTFLDILTIVTLAILITLFGFSITSRMFKNFLLRHLKKGMKVKREGREIGEIAGVEKRNNMISVETKKEEKTRIPFSRIKFLGQREIEVI